MKPIPLLLIALFFFAPGSPLRAQVAEETILYRDGDQELEGFVAKPEKVKGKVPGILIIHDWSGLDGYEKRRARMLARLGYVAFAADIYGKGVRPKEREEKAAESSKYKSDPPLYRSRLQASLDELRAQPNVDPQRIAAIGYCFGGTGVLELARSGADIAGVVSFHGGLDTNAPAKPGDIKASVLVLTGADDPYAPWSDIEKLDEELRQANADYQIVIYGDAVHSFSNPEAGDDKASGNAYDLEADRRSWEHMRFFFDEIFGPPR